MDVPLVEFIYLVFTRTPGGATVGDSGLCCCVPCPSSAIISLGLLIPFLLASPKKKIYGHYLVTLPQSSSYLIMETV